ncbi:NAD(P)-binding protein [Streptomyces goshikiensis]|uniref:NAD(P)-binding protein n=1 Tax=Streptomyces goshikiensis TaxID=1942 RepID=UPI00371CD56C
MLGANTDRPPRWRHGRQGAGSRPQGNASRVGAGVAGLTAAAVLAKAGASVQVVTEQVPGVTWVSTVLSVRCAT